MPATRVLWSWLLAARNDHYQGNPQERLATSLAVLAQGTGEHKLIDESEVVVADWNSVVPFYRADCSAPFRTLLRGPLFENRLSIRFVVIPPAIAMEHCRETLCEVHALNVAARHARGDMLLRIDQDTLVGRPVFRWLQSIKVGQDTPVGHPVLRLVRSLMHKASSAESTHHRQWWWCGRRDADAKDYDAMVADPIAFLDRHGHRINKWGWPKPEYTGNYSRDGRGGVGIFGVPRAVWLATGGLDENMIAWGHMEVEFQRRLRRHAAVLNPDDVLPTTGVDQPVYHLYHPRNIGGPSGQRKENAQPSPLSIEQLIKEDERRSKLPWGLRDAVAELIYVRCASGACHVLAGREGALARRAPCSWVPTGNPHALVSDELKLQYMDSLDLRVVATGGADVRGLLGYLSDRGVVASNDVSLDPHVQYAGRPLRTRTPVLLITHIDLAVAAYNQMGGWMIQHDLEGVYVGTRGYCSFRGAGAATLAQDLKDPLGIAKQLNDLLGVKSTAKMALIRGPYNKRVILKALISLGLKQKQRSLLVADGTRRLAQHQHDPPCSGDCTDMYVSSAESLLQSRYNETELEARYAPLKRALHALKKVHPIAPDRIDELRDVVLASRRLTDAAGRALLIERFCPVPHLVDQTIAAWERLGAITAAQVRAAVASAAGEGCFLVQWIRGRLFTKPKYCTDVANFPCFLLRARRRHLLNFLRAVLEASPLPDFEAAFCLGDCVVSEAANATSRHLGLPYKFVAGPLPAFVITGCSSSANIKFPIWDNYAPSDPTWSRNIAAMERVAARHPWRLRREQAIFRGGQRTCTKISPPAVNLASMTPSGIVQPCYIAKPGDPYAEHCGRTGLLHKALSSSLRAKFNVSLTSGYDWKEWYVKYGPPDKPTLVPFLEFGEFKFIINVEGHCHFANRLRSLLFLDAVLLKQEVHCGEFYDAGLRPWVHYIPISYTFSNLTAAMQWALSHPRELLQIRRNARKYARATLLPSRVVAFAQQLLERYARLLHYRVRLEPDAEPLTGPTDEQLNFWAEGAYEKSKGPCRRQDGRFDKAEASCSRVKTSGECYARCEGASATCKAFDWAKGRTASEGANCCTFSAEGATYRGDRSDQTVLCHVRPK